MFIKNHLLFEDDGAPMPFQATPHTGGNYKPQYLVIHYTGSANPQSTIDWFLNLQSQVSAHLLIARNGSITQFAPFNKITWHAGKSQWKGLSGLNRFAVGIELVNAGKLIKNGSSWRSQLDRTLIKNGEVMVAAHKNETTTNGWQEYSGRQLESAIEVSTLLVRTYNLFDVVGHDEISPFRKSDPGPAFPMTSFRAKVMGRKNELLDEYKINQQANIRSGPGTTYQELTAPLPKGTPISVLKTEGNWSFVEVRATVNGIMDLEGWVYSRLIGPPVQN